MAEAILLGLLLIAVGGFVSTDNMANPRLPKCQATWFTEQMHQTDRLPGS